MLPALSVALLDRSQYIIFWIAGSLFNLRKMFITLLSPELNYSLLNFTKSFGHRSSAHAHTTK